MECILEMYGNKNTRLFTCDSMQKKMNIKKHSGILFKKNYKPILYKSHILLHSVWRIMKKRRSHFIGTYHFSIFHFLSIKHSLHYEHIIIEKEIGLHFSSASIAAPISACWILLNKTKVGYTLKIFFKNKWYHYKLFRLIFMFGT